MKGYDQWLEEPYQRMYAEAERLACPKCDEQMTEDDGRFECDACGHAEQHQTEPDWDRIAEERAEARADAYERGEEY